VVNQLITSRINQQPTVESQVREWVFSYCCPLNMVADGVKRDAKKTKNSVTLLPSKQEYYLVRLVKENEPLRICFFKIVSVKVNTELVFQSAYLSIF
jgi:hypothetical protein